MQKGKSVKKQVEYIWMYYKTPILVTLAVVLSVICWIGAAASEKETALSVMLIDSLSSVPEEVLSEEFASYAGIDTDVYEVSIGTFYLFGESTTGTYAMASLSRFYTEIGTRRLDVCGMLEEDFANYAKSDCFLDLSGFFSEEELKDLSDWLYYKDGKPIGIYTEGLPGMEKAGCYTGAGDKGVLGIIYNSVHKEKAAEYLKYLGGE